MPPEKIGCIGVGRNGVLWFGHYNRAGISRYDLKSHSIVRFREAIPGHPLMANCIQTAPDGTLWLATQEGLYRYDDTLTTYGKPDGLLADWIGLAAQDAGRGLWFASFGEDEKFTTTFLGRFDPPGSEGSLGPFRAYSTEGGLRNTAAGCWDQLAPDSFGGLWAHHSCIVSYFNPPSSLATNQQPFTLPPILKEINDDSLASLFVDRENRLWVCRDGGMLWRYTVADFQAATTNFVPADLYRLNLTDLQTGHPHLEKIASLTNCAYTMFEDSKGVMWAGARNHPHGLCRVEGTNGRFCLSFLVALH